MSEIEYKAIKYEVVAEHVAKLTFNRPDRLNAYTPTMCKEAVLALAEYQHDDNLRVLILTGAGRGFCSGGDVKGDVDEFIQSRKKQMATFRRLQSAPQALNLALHRIEKPVIAMINGVAVSGGLSFAMMCDYRVAAESARLGDPSGRVGLLADEGGCWIFPRLMGMDKALKMVWFNEIYDAREALALGMVSEVVPDAELESRAMALATRLATRAPNSVAADKLMMRRSSELSLEASLGDAGIWAMWNNKQPDGQEGLAAFKEKREPKFTGATL
ncbi:MAG TPA: enoyl-CoA hydratase/isomerase family protein [Devosiaceae bacterium]